MKKALITGINGQDGSYLAELLISKGYEVHGIVRREAMEDSANRLHNISHIIDQIKLYTASIDNHLSIYKIINNVRPDECYHLAASSFVSYFFDDEMSVLSNNFNSTHFLLASIKELSPNCRFYFAGSSEMFGEADETPQNENTKFNPRSIYGISKVSGHYLVKNYRKHHKIFACTGILYNHESPRRKHQFVTRKITSTVARINLGLEDKLELGNLAAKRDWGHAREYVQAIWLMLQNDKPDDFVIATGQTHTVEQFAKAAFSYVGLNYKDFVKVDSRFFRLDEKVTLVGNPSKAKKHLGWHSSITLDQLVKEMVDNDLQIMDKN